MIISRTPFRISFFGGGTDYPSWYREHGGAVLAATIDKYCYLTCRQLPPFFEHRHRLVYSKIENCKSVDEIEHPVVKAVMKYLNVEQGVEIHHDGDLPARSGMGSSSSFTVGLLHALHALAGRMPTRRQLTLEALEIEQEVLKETVGSQDQTAAAYGGLNHVIFQRNGEIAVRPVAVAPSRVKQLESHLLLFYTGIRRTASDVAKTYVEDIDKRRRQLRILGQLVKEGLDVLNSDRDIRIFGELLHEGWMTKRSLSAQVSNDSIDSYYQRALQAGAVGGKITGAGGGGFLLLFVPPKEQARVRAEFPDLIHVPFRFENSGSQIIFYEPEEDFTMAARARHLQTAVTFRELTEARIN